MLFANCYRKIRNWWREWSLIDIVGLTGGFVLAGVYVLIAKSLRPESLLHSLLPNFATEVIGVWLSVRIIERIIRRRDKFHGMRRAFILELVTIEDEFARLFTYPYEWRVAEIEGKIIDIKDNWHLVSENLFHDEISQAQACIDLVRTSIPLCYRYIELLRDIKNCVHQIETTVSEANSVREAVRDTVQKSLWLYRANAVDPEEPIDLSSFVPVLLELCEKAKLYLSVADIQLIKSIVEKLSEKPVLKYHEILPLDLESEFAKRIWLSEIHWYRRLSKLEDDLKEGVLYDFTPETVEIERLINDESKFYPEGLIELSKEYLHLIRELGEIVQAIVNADNNLIRAINDLRANIEAETSLVTYFE